MATSEVEVSASPVSNETGYRSFELGEFGFARDEYFVYISWAAKGQRLSHTMSADAFLRATMRCVAWDFSTVGSTLTMFLALNSFMAA